MGKFSEVKVVNGQGAPREVPEAGLYPARCVALVDLGKQDEEYNGQSKKTAKIFLAFELCGEAGKDGKPFIVGEELTFSMGDKARLRRHVESWSGKKQEPNTNFDLDALVDTPCCLNLSNGKSAKGNAFAKIESITQPMKGQVIPPAATPKFVWEMAPEDPAGGFPDWLPYIFGQSVADKVADSAERNPNGRAGGAKANAARKTVEEQQEYFGKAAAGMGPVAVGAAAGGDGPAF